MFLGTIYATTAEVPNYFNDISNTSPQFAWCSGVVTIYSQVNNLLFVTVVSYISFSGHEHGVMNRIFPPMVSFTKHFVTKHFVAVC